MTDDSRRRRGSLTSEAGEEYKSENDLEEALLSGRSTRRTRGQLARSHSVCGTTNHHSDVEENCSSRTQAAPDRGEDGELRRDRPMSARRFRLTLLFDDGCSGRERVSARITSTTTDVTSTLRTRTSSTSSDNTDWTHHHDKHLDASSTTPKPRLRSSSVARIGLNRNISNSTSSLRDQPRSNLVKAEMKGQKDGRMNTNRSTSKHTDTHMAVCSTSNNAKKIADASNQKDIVNSKKPPPPVRRTSLDVKANNSDMKLSSRQSAAQRSRQQDQRSLKAGVHPSGTMSANSSPRLTRCAGNHTAR